MKRSDLGTWGKKPKIQMTNIDSASKLGIAMRTLLQTTLAAVMMVSLATSFANAQEIQQDNYTEPGTGVASLTPSISGCDTHCAPTCEAPVGDCCGFGALPCMDACCYEAAHCCGKRGCRIGGVHHHKCCGHVCVHTTGDMHPHYAYQPEHHGYYYFRPYNYVNVLEQKQLVVALGGDFKSPYSLAMFDGIYADFEATVPPLPEQPSPLVEDEEALPLLDALLN